jgi:sigma-B regulation protein RsbU (phosphoserine phosphatase)
MCTYSVPFYRNVDGKRIFSGVVTADIDLSWLQKMITDIEVYETGYVFLLSRYGTFISSPNPDLVMNETIFTLAEEKNVPELRDVGRSMLAGESGYREMEDLPGIGEAFIYYMPLPAEKWSLAIVFPKDEMLAGVTQLSHTVAIIGVVGFLALAALIISISGSITQPLRKLTVVANRIASGDLDQKVPEIRTRDEVGDLASSFKTMKISLKDYIANLTAATAARERIESELRIAREIQMGILPKLFPAFPDRTEFDVYASIEPAKEVGGDLYDFFFVDDRHFCFLVGDVSGKGVPAAFFMAVTKTLLKVVAERGLDPGQVLSKVNADLAAENESCMFVTLFLAIVDIETGETRYANAGHNPPVLLRRGQQPEWVPPLNEPVAGVMEGMEYSTKTMSMSPGDTLFIYTDGVTEAMDADKNMYSDPRLLDVLATLDCVTAEDLVATVDASIKAFTGGAEQSDDITMLAMQFHGPDGENKE